MAEDRLLQADSAIAAFVADTSTVAGVRSLGDGNINDTYLVICRPGPSLALQRINASVFPDPKGVVGNGAVVSRHLNLRGQAAVYRFPETVQTFDGCDWYEDADGEIWRCQTFIEHAVSLRSGISSRHAYEAGCLLGYFHRTLAGLDQRALCTPLPGFHDLSGYRQAYIDVLGMHQRAVSLDLDYCRSIAEQRLEDATLSDLAEAEGIGSRVIHGDPKYDNFLFDTETDRVVSLIDLDTTAPGLAAVDLGDCLRSFCNPGGERGVGGVSFDIDTCRELIGGYRSALITEPAERHLIYHAVRLMTYELGLRFFTDYLDDNRYFKMAGEAENLHRACVQFRLLENIEARRGDIEAIAGC
jgi:hypothetical protein